METLSDILEKGIQVNSETELKPLTAAIARNKATDRLRKHLAEKRGGNKVQSLEEMIEANAGEPPDIVHDGFVDHLAVQELRELLTNLSAEVKKEYRVILRDHFFDQLSCNEIAAKRKISVGSVGVYLQRGLTNLRNVIARRPKLQDEFFAMLSDASVVKVLLPLASAVQLGGWLVSHSAGMPKFSVKRLPKNLADNLTDEHRFQMLREELSDPPLLDELSQAALLEKLKEKHPTQFQVWQQGKEDRDRRQHEQEERIFKEKEARRLQQKSILHHRIIALLIVIIILYGIIRLTR